MISAGRRQAKAQPFPPLPRAPQVPGRQCLASAALLGPAPEEALPLLESIAEVGAAAGGDGCSGGARLAHPAPTLQGFECGVRSLQVCQGDDALSWNLGMARAAAGLWAEAAEALQQVQVQVRLQRVLGYEWVEHASACAHDLFPATCPASQAPCPRPTTHAEPTAAG